MMYGSAPIIAEMKNARTVLETDPDEIDVLTDRLRRITSLTAGAASLTAIEAAVRIEALARELATLKAVPVDADDSGLVNNLRSMGWLVPCVAASVAQDAANRIEQLARAYAAQSAELAKWRRETGSGNPTQAGCALREAIQGDPEEAAFAGLTKMRANGWRVAVHNDYQLNGEEFTFWLFTRGDRFVKGEARTDAAAITAALDAAEATEGSDEFERWVVAVTRHELREIPTRFHGYLHTAFGQRVTVEDARLAHLEQRENDR